MSLADLLATLRKRDVDLYLVRVMWPVRQALRRSGLAAEVGDDHMWHSISQGVREARRLHGLRGLPAQLEAPLEEEALAADHEEHIVAHEPGPAPQGLPGRGSA